MFKIENISEVLIILKKKIRSFEKKRLRLEYSHSAKDNCIKIVKRINHFSSKYSYLFFFIIFIHNLFSQFKSSHLNLPIFQL